MPAPPVEDLERFRGELTGYCYRMLGSPFDAEDAVQDVLLRAWNDRASFDGSRGSLRTWLYSIATHRCLDVLRSASRRELAMDMGPAFAVGPELGDPLPESSWVLPAPDMMVAPASADPAVRIVLRESIRLAFVAALQVLPPTQRAALILKDVLGYSAADIAEILDTSTAAVNSALQRARAALAPQRTRAAPLEQPPTELVAEYRRAFEADDIDALVALLRSDAWTSMPPYPWWLQGRADIEAALRAAGSPCAGSKLVVVEANGTSAFARYSPDGEGRLVPFGLTVMEWRDEQVASMVTFLDSPARVFTMFGLADEFGKAVSY